MAGAGLIQQQSDVSDFLVQRLVAIDSESSRMDPAPNRAVTIAADRGLPDATAQRQPTHRDIQGPLQGALRSHGRPLQSNRLRTCRLGVRVPPGARLLAVGATLAGNSRIKSRLLAQKLTYIPAPEPGCCRGTVAGGKPFSHAAGPTQASSSRSVFASFRSAVSKPSVNQP
jgi:hypothetical protein